MMRVTFVACLAALMIFVLSLSLAPAAMPPDQEALAAIGPVDCATFTPPVVAYDITKGQTTSDVPSFLNDLLLDSFSVGTVNGSVPACVDILIIRSVSGTLGLASPYTPAEAASIKSWVDAGHALMLFSDWGAYRDGTAAIFSVFGYGVGGPSALTDPNDFDSIGGSDWVIYQADNFAPHSILEGVASVELLRSAWFSQTAGSIVKSDANSSPSSVPVMAVIASGSGCALFSSDSDWVNTNLPLIRAGYFKRDNAILARQAASWLQGCGKAPTARAGGPYVINEGSSIMLNGSASSDPGGKVLTYAWDLDNNHQFNDAFNANPIFSAALRDNGVYTVSLRVGNGVYTDTGSTHVTVLNVSPTVSLSAAARSVPVGAAINFTGSFTDPGALDTHTLQWNFGDGTPVAYGLPTRAHAFTATGRYTITLTVTDDDGGVGQASVAITVMALNAKPVFLPLSLRNFCVPATQYSDIVLALDTSSSMNQITTPGGPTKLAAAKSAATHFLNALLFPGDQAALVAYDDVANLEHVLSDNRVTLLATLQALKASGITRMDLGLSVARSELLSPRHRLTNGRAIVLLTDGRPNGTTEEEVLNQAAAAKAAGIKIYTIGLGNDVNAALLQQIASSPDRYYFSPTTEQLTGIYERIVGVVRCS